MRQTAPTNSHKRPAASSTSLRRFVARALAFLLFAQTAAPPALAGTPRDFPLAALGGRVTAKVAALLGSLGAGGRTAAAKPAVQVVASPDFGLVLTPLNTPFGEHFGIEHHQPLRRVVVSSNSPNGSPINFETLQEDGTHRPFSNVGGLQGELKLAVARGEGQGVSPGGFRPGELFTGTSLPGRIARVSADGATVRNPWVTLPGEAGELSGGLAFDRAGTFGGDLIAVTTAGGVWRINSTGAATRVAALGTRLEGIATVPNDAVKYGPWAGRILAGAKEQSAVYAIDAAGNWASYQLGVTPSDIRVIPAHENFYGVDAGAKKIWAAPDDAFAGIIGDVLVAQESPGVLARVRWNGTAFEVGRLAEVSRWGQVTFSPAGVAGFGGVKQHYEEIAVVRHAPQLDSGRVEGSLWQLTGEGVALDGTDVITNDLLVPGVPKVSVGAGKPSFGGVVEGVESKQPTNYTVTVSNNAVLRHVITRTNPIELSPVAAPPAPAGTRDVLIKKAGESIGDPATLRHLNITGHAGEVSVPPGTYGGFSANGRGVLVLGSGNSAAPAVYNLEYLSLSGGSELRLVGSVILNVRGNVSLVGTTVGAADNPRRLLLRIAEGALGVTGNGVLYAVVRVPGGSVSIGGNGRVRGTVTCDRLNIHGNGVLQITEGDLAPPPVNRPPSADAGPDQSFTLPVNIVNLNGLVTDDGLPPGSTLASTWTKVSGPGPVTFADAASVTTTATFNAPGLYVLRLTASDSLLTASDEMTVEVLERNLPPTVDAGPDQSVELPNTATLNGTVTDDGLPRGSTVTNTWSVVGGPGSVAFADKHSPTTAVTFGAHGTYTLRLTTDDTELTASDDVVITVYPENQPPVVGAGPDQTVRLPKAVALGGTATDDGLPPGSALTTSWTKVSGPGAVNFADAGSPATTATFSVEGTYTLRLSASDTRFDVSDECVVTMLPANAPPAVNAGPDREITFLEAPTLGGTVSDDGMPVGSVLEVAWSQVSGPGTVVFANPDRPVTPVTFSAPGTYVLRLTGDDTQFNASDEATVVVKPRPHASRVYTLDADFELGDLINVTHGTADQLQLDDKTRSFNFIWVAVSTKGTVVKINTETGAIIGEYHTAPSGQPKDPSRTTVDQNGNVWATNRAGNSVVHIGLVENGQCVDRNGNGVIDTSHGLNDIRVWTNAGGANTNGGVTTAADECILHYTRVNSFGTRHVSVTKDNDLWVSGITGQRFDLLDGKTGVIKRAEPSVGYGGYGGLIDGNGVIWSANPMLRWDTALPLSGPNGVNWRGYSHPSYGLCIDSQGNVYNTTYGNGVIHKFAPNGTLIASYNQGSPWAQGCVVDRNDDVWIAHSTNMSSVGHLKSNGTYVGTVGVGSGPTGVAVDGAGKVWATNYNSGTVSRINPALGPIGGDGVTRIGAVDFTTPHLGGNLYNYSDMTGSTLTGAPNIGTWSVVFDSQIAGAEWSRIGWTAQACGDGLLTVSVATSANNVSYTQPLVVSNGDDPVVANGRYVKITVRFERASSGESPVLYDLSIGTIGFPLGAPANVAPGIDAGPDQTINDTLKTALRASVCDDALPSNRRLSMAWSLVSGPGAATFSKPNSLVSDVTFGATGIYTLRMTASDSAHTGSDTLVVNVVPGNQPPAVNAGVDQTIVLPATAALEGVVTDDGLPTGATLTPTWSELSGPGLVTFADAHQPRTTASFSAAGTYVLRLEASDTQKGAFDDVTVEVKLNQPPNVSAGPDRTVAVGGTATLEGTATDDGLPSNTINSSWSMVSGPGLANFADPSSPATNATFSEPGIYVLRLSATDTALGASDETVVTVTPPNRAPEVNAGADRAVTLPGVARLSGTATDDGLPPNSTLLFSWTKVSGPGAVNFADASAARTTAAFGDAGTYVLRLTASDSDLSGSDELTVTVNPVAPNSAPVVNAGADQTVILNFNHVQNPGNDEPLVGGEIRGWTEAVGNAWTRGAAGAGGFPEAFNGNSFFYAGETASAELRQDIDVSAFAATIATGTQSFEWKAYVRSRAETLPDTARVILEYRNAANTALLARLDSGEVSSTAGWQSIEDTRPVPAGTGWIRIRLISTRRTGATNDAYFDALSLRAMTGAGVRLSGAVTDDGLPAAGTLNVNWTKVSGPGAVTFANASAPATSATFDAPGVYVLRLAADDSELTSGDEVTVTVEARNLAPVVDAGSDQTITLPATAALGGTVNDDGKPSGAAVTSTWSKVSGPGSVTFDNSASAVTNATFGAQGTYVLRLSASDTEYGVGDTININVNPIPPNAAPTVNAGPDQLIEPPATVANLSAIVNDDGLPPGNSLTYSWTKVSGPGGVTFGSPTSAATTATFGDAGVYVLRLTANDSQLSGSDDVRVTLNGPNKAPTVNAGADQTVAHPTTVNLGGTATDDGLPLNSTLSFSWTKVSGPGTVNFANASAARTTATFSAAGAYVLRLTATDSDLSGSDDVSVTQTPPPTATISSPANGVVITGPTNFVGTVSEGSTWRLEYSLDEEGVTPVWTVVASGNTPVNNGTLGTFDPTVLLNGIYNVRLVATNGSGQTTTTSVTATAEGEQKVGNFRISFTDLSVPVAGIPIEVIRTYDSRDKRVGDFGVGWTVDVRNVRLQESGTVGLGWAGTRSAGFIPSYCGQATRPHIVTVTMSNDEVFKFEATLNPQCGTLYPLRETTIGFRALPGTDATLAPVGDPTAYVNGVFPGALELLDYDTFEPIDFDQYRLTLPSGEVALIDQRAGLRQMTDANGNTLTVGANGITHSSGKSVTFTRDAQGRITQITDPSGAKMTYSYDARGDLVGFTDRENNLSTYTYNSSHGLLTIKDPTGNQPVRNEYDDAGRLVRQIDAFGKVININSNPNTRQEVITDRLGHATIYEYNGRGQVVRITDPNGGVTTRTFDSRDNLLSETDAAGKVTTYTYDALGRRSSVRDPLGHTNTFTYNSRNQELTETDPLGRVTTRAYDANGNPTSVKDTLGNTVSATYTSGGLPLTETDELGNVTAYQYDGAGNVVRQTDALGNVTTYTYDANNNRLSQTVSRALPGGAVETLATAFEYDRLGHLIKTTHPDGAVSRTLYDSRGQVSATIDPLGRQTTYEYDLMNRLSRTTYPDGMKEEVTYDAEGRQVKTIDRAGRATTYAYDSLGRPTTTTYPDGTSASNSYDAAGHVSAVTNERGHATTYEYDAAGRTTKVTDARGNVTAFTYDAADNKLSMTDARGNTTRYEYDAGNRLLRTLHADGTTRQTAYDAKGRAASRTDQAGRTTQYAYDRLGRLLKVTDALGKETRYVYDALGKRVEQIDANNRTTRFEYDRMGRRTKRTLPLGQSETFVYDAAGNLTARTDFRGKTTGYSYDALNRLTSKTPDASFGQPQVSFTYTPAGKRATMSDASGTTAYTYDDRDRLLTKSTPHGELSYSYDAAGNLLSVTSSNAGGASVAYTYDELNRLSSVNDRRVGAGSTTYTYDAAGNLSGYIFPNGVRTAYTYNSLNRLTNLAVSKTSTLAAYAYTLGPAGNRLSVAEAGGRTVGYTYDATYRLTGESINGDPSGNNGSVGYTYDAVGNRLTRASTVAAIGPRALSYDANDRLAGDAYDADGNTVASGVNVYAYDFEDRLSEVNGGAIRVVYDGDGNRVSQTAGGVTTRYLVDENNHTGHAQVLEELDGGGVVRRVYTYGHDLISQNQLLGGVWSVSYYGYDGHGSVRLLTDGGGAVTDTYDYDAFGNILARTGTTPNEHLYSGERLDPNLGFYYLRARYYRAETGRFLTVDPFEGKEFEPLSLHKYLYAHADPVNNIDPSGLMSISSFSTTALSGLISVISTVRIVPLLTALRVNVFLAGGVSSYLLTRGQQALRLLQNSGDRGIRAMQTVMMRSNYIVSEAEAKQGAIWRNARAMREALNKAITGGIRNPVGIHWHHPVEQGGKNAERFKDSLQSLVNYIPTPTHVHNEINKFFSRGAPWAAAQNFSTVRQWMQTQSWDRQYEAGLEIWKQAMRGGPITWHP